MSSATNAKKHIKIVFKVFGYKLCFVGVLDVCVRY